MHTCYFRLVEVTGTDTMHRLVTVSSDASERLVAEDGAAAAVAANSSRSSTSHRHVVPLIIDARPVILVSGRQVMPAAAAGPVVVIQHPLPLSADCSAELRSSAPSQSHSQSTSCTRHKRKRRRRNKVRCDQF